MPPCAAVRSLIARKGAAQRTPEWFAARREKLTGSIIASIIGVNKYQSAQKAMLLKTGIERFGGNIACAHGTKLEPVACAAYERETGKVLIKHDLGLIAHQDEDYIAASPDGVTEDGILLEIKCPFRRKIVKGQVPTHYIPQLQVLMHCLQLKVAHYYEYIPALTPWAEPETNLVVVKRDEDFIKRHRGRLMHFHAQMRRKQQQYDRDPEALARAIKLNEMKKASRRRKPQAKATPEFPFILSEEEETPKQEQPEFPFVLDEEELFGGAVSSEDEAPPERARARANLVSA